MGSVLYEKVLYHLDLVETDYFGLQFSDTSNVNVSQSFMHVTAAPLRRRSGADWSLTCNGTTRYRTSKHL